MSYPPTRLVGVWCQTVGDGGRRPGGGAPRARAPSTRHHQADLQIRIFTTCSPWGLQVPPSDHMQDTAECRWSTSTCQMDGPLRNQLSGAGGQFGSGCCCSVASFPVLTTLPTSTILLSIWIMAPSKDWPDFLSPLSTSADTCEFLHLIF